MRYRHTFLISLIILLMPFGLMAAGDERGIYIFFMLAAVFVLFVLVYVIYRFSTDLKDHPQFIRNPGVRPLLIIGTCFMIVVTLAVLAKGCSIYPK